MIEPSIVFDKKISKTDMEGRFTLVDKKTHEEFV